MMDEITSLILALLESLLRPTFSILHSLIFPHIFIISLLSPCIDLLVLHGKQVKKIKRYIETKHGVLDWCKIRRMVWKIGCIKFASWCRSCFLLCFLFFWRQCIVARVKYFGQCFTLIWSMLRQTTKSSFYHNYLHMLEPIPLESVRWQHHCFGYILVDQVLH